MTPVPDWSELGRHNRGLVNRIRLDKMIEDKKRRDRRESIIYGCLSVVLILIGVALWMLH